MDRLKENKILRFMFIIAIFLAIIFYFVRFSKIKIQKIEFDSSNAYQNIETQLRFGPRVPGTIAHEEFIQWAGVTLEKCKWQVEYQTGEYLDQPLTNIIAKKGAGTEVVILSTHYDSRILADQDPEFPAINEPVPGANDGASGVAILMELARVLDIPADKQVWIVLFDIEDNGGLPGWKWIMGSEYFVDHLTITPAVVINIDMVGDQELQIFKERTSTTWVNDDIWRIAEEMGYGNIFISKYAYSIIDDHLPFLRKGISAIDIIDMDYPFWHTRADDISKISSQSLGIVGKVIEEWIEK